MVTPFDNCRGCVACVTACPSGVRYDLLIEDTRQQVERLHPRTPRERLLRRALFATFPHPGRLRATVPLLVFYRHPGPAAAPPPARAPRRRALFATPPPPGRLRATVPLLVFYRHSGLAAALQRARLLDRFP